MQRSEVNTREKLLEIEYRLAEVAEKIKTSNTNDQTCKAINDLAKAIIDNVK